MSLILEALKKSEAKRRLGETPDLATPFAGAAPRRSPLLFILVGIVIAGGAGWWLLGAPPGTDTSAPTQPQLKANTAPALKSPADRPKATATAQSPVPAAPSATGADVAAADHPASKPSVEPASARKPLAFVAVQDHGASAPGGGPGKPMPRSAEASMAGPRTLLPPPAAPAASPAVAATADATKAPTPAAAPKKPAPTPAETPVAEQKAPPAPTAPADAATATRDAANEKNTTVAAQSSAGSAPPPAASAQPFYELPFSVRKDLPALRLNMHVYAADAAQRFVILNNSRMAEGDSQDDLALREIRPDGVVLEFKGQRFFYPRDGL